MSKISRFFCCIFCMVILACSATSIVTVSAASKNTVTTSISKVEAKGNAFKVTWKKKSKIKGYQIQYSTSSKFKKSETQTKTVSKAKTTSATVSKLKGCNKKYYVRVRTYKVVKDKKVYSSWSKAKSVTTLKHKYSAATCTKAKTCKYCSKTSGEKLGHNYSAATCTKAKTCTRCKATSGKALGHKYAAATCTKAKTCTRCKATSGKALGHKWSKWTTTIPAEVGKKGQQKRTCSRCGKKMTKTIPALQKDLTKQWFLTQYNIALEQHLFDVYASISNKNNAVTDLRSQASSYYSAYQSEIMQIKNKCANMGMSNSGYESRLLKDAENKYLSNVNGVSSQIKQLEEEISELEYELAYPSLENVLFVLSENCDISMQEAEEYYYLYVV